MTLDHFLAEFTEALRIVPCQWVPGARVRFTWEDESRGAVVTLDPITLVVLHRTGRVYSLLDARVGLLLGMTTWDILDVLDASDHPREVHRGQPPLGDRVAAIRGRLLFALATIIAEPRVGGGGEAYGAPGGA